MTDPLAEKLGINVQGGTVNVQNLNIGIAARLEQSGDRVRILVVAANPLGSSPLKLDHEVKTIQEALRRSRKRDNFVVEYRLAATPSELRRALLDLEPHVLHFSGHGSGEQGLLFVSDDSAGAIYRSDSGEVRSRSTNSNEIKFVPAQPLANLLQLCDEHLECVVLNACYSDVQGDAISANIPFTIGMRDLVEDHVAIKFSQGFYDAIGAGKGYENAFKWGKVAIEFDLANNEASQILVLRKKSESFPQSIPVPPQIPISPPNLQYSLSDPEYFNRGNAKQVLEDKEGAILQELATVNQTVSHIDQVRLDNGESFVNNLAANKSFSYEVIEVNLKGLKISQQRKYAEYYREKLDEKIYLDMVFISFMSNDLENLSQKQDNEYHQGNTSIPSFWMSKYPVIQSQWKSVAKLPKIKYELELEPARFKGANLPIEKISWLEAEEFCERISKKTGKKYRLPSEFEWEYACRAGTKTPYHFGETITTEIANYKDRQKNSPEQTTLVGSYRVANDFGLFDMHGNVWEWCKDVWDVNQKFRNLSEKSCYRVIRGGSWFDDKPNCCSSSRRQAEQENKNDTLGFRVVMDIN